MLCRCLFWHPRNTLRLPTSVVSYLSLSLVARNVVLYRDIAVSPDMCSYFSYPSPAHNFPASCLQSSSYRGTIRVHEIVEVMCVMSHRVHEEEADMKSIGALWSRSIKAWTKSRDYFRSSLLVCIGLSHYLQIPVCHVSIPAIWCSIYCYYRHGVSPAQFLQLQKCG